MDNYQLQMDKLKTLRMIFPFVMSWIQHHCWLGNRIPIYSISLPQRLLRNQTTSEQIRKFKPEDR